MSAGFRLPDQPDGVASSTLHAILDNARADADRAHKLHGEACDEIDRLAAQLREVKKWGRLHVKRAELAEQERAAAVAEAGQLRDENELLRAQMVDLARLRELAAALNRAEAKYPNPFYVGFGSAILLAIGDAPAGGVRC